MKIFGGRWTLAHLVLPLLASAYMAIAVGLVYNLLVKTAWDFWDRRTKYEPAPSPERNLSRAWTKGLKHSRRVPGMV